MSAIPIHLGAPEWFRRALAVPFTDEVVSVAGRAIHYLAWGDAYRDRLERARGGRVVTRRTPDLLGVLPRLSGGQSVRNR